MKIGIVAYWFNGGQGVVGRHLRSALDSLGHETFVLARPAPDRFVWPGQVRTDDVWAQERVTPGSKRQIPGAEYERWASDNALDAIFFDQNYQFDEIRALSEAGILTLGRFVWESFGENHVAPARAALDVIYSLTTCEQDRYLSFGIQSPRVHWGCHPELLGNPPAAESHDEVRFFYPGGQLSLRKPTGAVVEAFRRVDAPNLRLIIKAQRPLQRRDLMPSEDLADLAAAGDECPGEDLAAELEATDERIRVITHDLSTDDHHAVFRSADVCLAPSRWEGLGLHLFESVSFGLPLIVNADPPANEVVTHGVNGLLVDSFQIGTAPSGIPAWEPKVDSLREAIEALADERQREALSAGAVRTQHRLPWRRTVEDLGRLLQ
jgi:glycosyltransferase involved in cell wall biosynthesis